MGELHNKRHQPQPSFLIAAGTPGHSCPGRQDHHYFCLEILASVKIPSSIIFSFTHLWFGFTLYIIGRGSGDAPQDNLKTAGQGAFLSSLSWQGI